MAHSCLWESHSVNMLESLISSSWVWNIVHRFSRSILISESVSCSEELDGVLIFRCVWLCNNHFNLVNTSMRPPNLQIFIGCELSVCMGVCDFIAESTNDVLKRIKKYYVGIHCNSVWKIIHVLWRRKGTISVKKSLMTDSVGTCLLWAKRIINLF